MRLQHFKMKAFMKSIYGSDISVNELQFLWLTYDPDACYQFSSNWTPFQAAHKS